jgi:DNA-binding CsgD family transcriptional regulator
VTALTARERQVLQLLAGGHIQAAIARRLDVTPRTVGRTTAALYAKLGAHTAAEAVAVAYRRGLLGDDVARLWRAAGYRLALVPMRTPA